MNYDHLRYADQYIAAMMKLLGPDFKAWYRHPERHIAYKIVHEEVYGRDINDYYEHDDNGLSFPLYLLMRAQEKRPNHFLALNAAAIQRWAAVCLKQDAMNIREYNEILDHVEASVIKYDFVQVDNRPVAKNAKVLANRYGKRIFMDLAEKFGRNVVQVARDVLNINEFELRFGL